MVRAAIAIADDEGLGSVSLRKVAAALGAGPMRLYGYISTKEELLDLMIDTVYGEILAKGDIRGDWREILAEIAHRTRRACHDHRWFIDLLGGRPHIGPNSLAFLEAALAALGAAPRFDDIDNSMQALSTVNAYVIGAVRGELSGNLSKAEWQQVSWPYLERQIATGKFPKLEQVIRDASDTTPDTVFDTGLDAVLKGLAAQLPL